MKRQHVVHSVRGGVAHPAGAAARADATAFTGEGNKQIPAAVASVEAEKAMREDAALEVGAKRLLDVAGEAPIVGLAGVREEGLQNPFSDERMSRIRASSSSK